MQEQWHKKTLHLYTNNQLKIKKMTKKDFSKSVKIYKSHRLANGFISITFAYVYNSTSVSTQQTVAIENTGGALTSLYNYLTGQNV